MNKEVCYGIIYLIEKTCILLYSTVQYFHVEYNSDTTRLWKVPECNHKSRNLFLIFIFFLTQKGSPVEVPPELKKSKLQHKVLYTSLESFGINRTLGNQKNTAKTLSIVLILNS